MTDKLPLMYLTSSDCIECQKCLLKCPVGAIRKTEDGYYLTCIGCGRCAEMCPSKAIRRTRRGGLIVDRSKCTGCGLCVAACPINVLRLEKGYPTGMCLRCGLCARECPAGSRIEVKDGLKAFGLAGREPPEAVADA